MKQQILDALNDMKLKVVIDKKHTYTDNETGLKLQGVSSVSSIVPKDWLSAWGAKEAVKALGYSDYEGDVELANIILEKIRNCKTVQEYLGILKEAKGASARKSGQARIDGKVGHEWLENFVKAKASGSELPQLPTGPLLRPIEQFLNWEKENVKEWVASEALVAYLPKADEIDKVPYAGTLDAIAIMKDNTLALIDFKFASHISEDYYLQTAGYAYTFEAYGIVFNKRIIIRLPKTLEQDEWDKEKWCYKKVPNNIEVKEPPLSYETDRNAFLHALPVKGWINAVTKLTDAS